MFKLFSAVFLFTFSLLAYAGQNDFQVLEIEYDVDKVVSVGVHAGSQAFFMNQQGESFVVVPQLGSMSLYSVNANGAKMGKKAKQIEASDMTFLESALVKEGKVNFKSNNVSINAMPINEQKFSLEELQTRDRVEDAILKSGGMTNDSVVLKTKE